MLNLYKQSSKTRVLLLSVGTLLALLSLSYAQFSGSFSGKVPIENSDHHAKEPKLLQVPEGSNTGADLDPNDKPDAAKTAETSLTANILDETIKGTVFRDHNANGLYEALPASTSTNYTYGEPGVGGVKVTAYDASGAMLATTQSSPTGAYTLNVAGSGPYRIEFTELPAGTFDGAKSTPGNTSVQFLASGGTANFGLNKPIDYCQNEFQYVTTCFARNENTSADPVLVSFLNTGGSNSSSSEASYDSPPQHPIKVPVNQLGTIWGLAYDRFDNKIYASAFQKTETLMAPSNTDNSLGVIYQIDNAGNSATAADGTIVSGVEWVDLNDAVYLNGAIGNVKSDTRARNRSRRTR